MKNCIGENFKGASAITLLLFFSFFNLNGQVCIISPINITANTTPATCIIGGSATVNITNGFPPYTYSWFPNVSSTKSASNLAPGTYSVNVMDTRCHSQPGQELVVNGNFSSGNTGFTSGYTYCNTSQCLFTEGYYSVGSNPQFYHSNFFGTDHTTGNGNFMIINGNTIQGISIWCQTVNVTPNTNYIFSTWLSAMNTTSPAQLQFSINGTAIGNNFFAPSTTNSWIQFCTVWNSGSNTTANICIDNQSIILAGNDFGLDDISFRPCSPATLTFTIAPPPPVVSAANSSNAVCGGFGTANVAASGGTPTYSYSWSNGQSTSSVAGLTTGIYSVTVTDGAGCTSTNTVSILNTGSLTATAGPNTTICSGSSQSLILNASGGSNYLWSTSATTSSISVSPATTTSYSVIVSKGNCADTGYVTVTVNPQPTAIPSGTNICFNNQTNFTDLSTGNNSISNWAWDFGDGNNSSIQNPGHTYSSAGPFTVTLIVTNNFGCKDTNSVVVNVFPLPLANFTFSNACFGNPVSFTNLSSVSSGSITAWSWNFGDPNSGTNNISNTTSPTHIFSAAGNYVVVLTVTSSDGCQNTLNLSIAISSPPVAMFTNISSCLNNPTSYTNNSTSPAIDPINAWTWNFGDGSTNSILQTPSHTYATAGTFTTTLLVTTIAGCKDTTTNIVTVYNLPVVNFSDSAKGCSPVCGKFTDLSSATSGTINSWLWSFPGGNPSTSTSSSPSVCWTSPGSYAVQLVVTSSVGCTDSVIKHQYVQVYPWPTADFCVAPDKAPATNPVFNFCDLWSKDVVQWTWNFGDNTTDVTNTDPTHSYLSAITGNDFYNFNVCLQVQNQYGCWDTTCKTVELIPEYVFYIPNTFTPNSDMTNDFFFGKGRGIKEYSIWLFDRWGNQIWDCHISENNKDLDNNGKDGLSSLCQWNGNVEGGGMDMGGNTNKLAQEDVYVWKVNLTDIFDRRHTYVGHVNVIR